MILIVVFKEWERRREVSSLVLKRKVFLPCLASTSLPSRWVTQS